MIAHFPTFPCEIPILLYPPSLKGPLPSGGFPGIGQYGVTTPRALWLRLEWIPQNEIVMFSQNTRKECYNLK